MLPLGGGFDLDQNIIAAWSLSLSELEFVHGRSHTMRVGVASRLLLDRSRGIFFWYISLHEVPSNAME